MPYPREPGLYWLRSYFTYAVVDVQYSHVNECYYYFDKDGNITFVRSTIEERWGDCRTLPLEMSGCVATIPQPDEMTLLSHGVITWRRL